MSVFDIKPYELPSFRISAALANKVEKNLCFVIGGGLGDRVCAEPTLRYAINTFKDCTVSIVCDTPEIYSHLKFANVFKDVTEVNPNKFLFLYTYPTSPLFNQFVSPNLTNGVDYASLSALRMHLPRSQKFIANYPDADETVKRFIYRGPAIVQGWNSYVLHVGKSWPSRTFPDEWWVKLALSLASTPYAKVILVGNKGVNLGGINYDKFQGLIVDLTGDTTFHDLAWLCKRADAVISNDSLPIHLAASGGAKIAFVATCKRVDLLAHWRCTDKGRIEFGWRTKEFSKRPMWELFDHCPNNFKAPSIYKVPEGYKIEDFLPDPSEIVSWVTNGKD